MISNPKSKRPTPSLCDETHISSSFVTNHTLLRKDVNLRNLSRGLALCAKDAWGALPVVPSFHPPQKVYTIGYYVCSHFADDDSEEERGRVQTPLPD